MKRIVFILALALFSFHSYAQSTASPKPSTAVDQTQYLQVFINAKGKIYVDGEKTRLKDFEQLLSDLKKRNGYIRLAKEGKYTKKTLATSQKVSQLIKKYGRGIRTYTDNTFTKELTF